MVKTVCAATSSGCNYVIYSWQTIRN